LRINGVSDYIDSIKHEDAFKKIVKLYNVSSQVALEAYIADNYEKFVEFYEQVRRYEKDPSSFSITDCIDSNGAIDLTKILYIPSIVNARGGKSKFSDRWIITPDLRTYLIKRNPRYSSSVKHPYYNILITNKIAQKMNVPCAQYYLARNGSDCDVGNNITCNFLKDGESLISGEQVVTYASFGCPTELLSSRLLYIEKYLKYMKVEPEVMEEIRRNYIKLAFLNRFINNTDEADWNYGLIYDGVSKKITGLAPGFDFDFTLNAHPDIGRALLLDDGTSEITSFIEQFKHEQWFRGFVQEFINNFNIEEVLQEVQAEHRVTIEQEELERNTKFLEQQFSMVKRAVELHFGSEEPTVREEMY